MVELRNIGKGTKMQFEIVFCYINEKKWRNLVVAVSMGFLLLVFYLYEIPIRVLGYSALLCITVFMIGTVSEFYFYREKYIDRQKLFQSLEYNIQSLEPSYEKMEQDYRKLLWQLLQEKKKEKKEMDLKYQELKEYILMWAHQIKTPITALKLLLQRMEEDINLTGEEMKQIRYMKEEMFAIESYVAMNLEYIRLDSLNADLSIGKCYLEKTVKAEVSRFSPLFIAKKLFVKIEDLNQTVITDEKWFSFVLGQILSNAVKYTKKGGVTISGRECEDGVLVSIMDTGVGIAKEDIPRLFEKAFTGYNGHIDKHATGIGLYLSKRILERLGHSIAIHSEPGKGTCVEIKIYSKSG